MVEWGMLQVGIIAASVFGSTGLVIIAQADLGELQQIAGGSLLVAVSVLLGRYVMNTSERIEALWTGAVATAQDTAARAQERAQDAEKRLEATKLLLDEERALRMRFEAELAQMRREAL